MSPATRTTAPASSTSMAGAADASDDIASVTIGTKPAVGGLAVSRGIAATSRRAACRQVNTCCGHTCQRRATSDTRAPGNRVSATTRAFSSADQRRRRPGPVSISMRRKPPFASALTSNIALARSSLPHAMRTAPHTLWNKGARAPLTIKGTQLMTQGGLRGAIRSLSCASFHNVAELVAHILISTASSRGAAIRLDQDGGPSEVNSNSAC